MRCPHCDETVEEQAATCPKCAKAVAKAEQDREKHRGNLALIMGLSASAVLLLLATMWINGFRLPNGLSKQDQATYDMDEIGRALAMYGLVNRESPSSLDELMHAHAATGEVFLPSVPLDPWGQAYRYTPLGRRGYRLVSNGDDGRPDTQDDLVLELDR